MSGIEIVGLVLGAVPLVISSLEHYEEGIPHFRDYRHVSSQLKATEEQLRFQQSILQDTLWLQLSQVLSEPEIRELLSDPRSPKWQAPKVESGLKESLGAGYDVFMVLISRLFDTVSSLERTLQNITKDSKIGNKPAVRTRVKWALSESQTRQTLDRIKKYNEELADLIKRTAATETTASPQGIREISSAQAIVNINTSLKTFLEVQEVAQTVEDLTVGEAGIPEEVDDDVQSMYSVETEAESEGPTLRYLPLSLEAVDVRLPGGNLKLEALLDTGATDCAISMTLAAQLGLSTVEASDQKTVGTAGVNRDLPVWGKAQLNFRWRDADGQPSGIKTWVYVVYGLAHPVLLSNDFIDRHKLWTIAKSKVHDGQPPQLNLTWFNKLSKEQQKAEDEYRAKRLEENTARASSEAELRRASIEQKLDSGSTTAGSSAASTSGTSTSGSTNN